MSKVPVHNPGRHHMHVGGTVIPPGDTRMVAAHLVPASRTPAAPVADKPPPSPLDELLAGKAADAIAALPDLPDEDLAALYTAEAAKPKPRSTVLEAVAAEQLNRQKEGGEGEGNTGDGEGNTSAGAGTETKA